MFCFFFNDTATTEIYTLSLHDALPIFDDAAGRPGLQSRLASRRPFRQGCRERSEEHTSELQSRQYLVCRLLLEKKKTHNSVHRSRPHQSKLVSPHILSILCLFQTKTKL